MAFCTFPWLRHRANNDVATWSSFLGRAVSVLQLDQLNRNANGTSRVPGLANYVDWLRQWNIVRQQWMTRSDERLKEMTKFGKERLNKMFDMIYAEQLGEHPDGTAFQGRVSEADAARIYGVDPELYAMRDQIATDFKDYIAQIEQHLLADARRKFTVGSPELLAAEQRIRADFAALQAQPYFPLMRFGKFTLTVRNAQGVMQDFEQFETEHERDRAHQAAKRAHPSWDVKSGMLTDQLATFAGMPPTLVEAITDTLQLTPDQREQLKDLSHRMAPGQSFRKRLIKRRKVKGFSEDGMRTYASYFFHGANHLARVQYSFRLEESINEIKDQGRGVENATKLDGIRGTLNKHLEYILNPKNELAGLRAWGFLWYLGFMPKAAFINFSQIPLATYPYLAARHGDASVVAELGRAMKQVFTGISRDSGLSTSDIWMLERLLEEGKINQSFATELAAVANGTYLGKMLQSSPKNRILTDLVGKGAVMFSLAEQVNRRVTALASFRLAMRDVMRAQNITDLNSLGNVERNQLLNEGLRQARDAIDTTQFEYSNWNRPDFMRGKKSAIFMFMLYMQNMLFFIGRDPGSTRLLGMLVMMAGLQGLPFAEDLLDLIDTMFSTKNRKFDGRKELREFIDQLGMNPDLLLHGSAHYGFGLRWLGDQVGMPMPESDLSASLSMGRVIPGFEPLSDLAGAATGQPMSDFEHTLMEFEEGAGGALLAIPMNIMRAMYSDSPNTWKRMEMAMPAAAKSVSRAVRFATTGEETTLGGAPVVELDLTDSKTQADILAQALGFHPRMITKAQRQRAKMKEVEVFYSVRRRMLMSDYAFALRSGDKDAIRDSLNAVTRYNRDVPYRELGLSRKDLVQSVKSRRRTRQRAEHKLPVSERYIRLTKDTGEAFE